MTEKASENGGSRGNGDLWNSADEVALSGRQGVEQQNWLVAGSQSSGDSIADPSSQTGTDMHGHDDSEGQDLLWGELSAVFNAVLGEQLDVLVPPQRLSPENFWE